MENFGTATITDCTVSGNSAAQNGGGLDNQSGTVTLRGNTIVAGNTATTGGPDAHGTFASSGHNLIGATDGSTGWVGSDLTGTAAQPLDPLLAPLGNYGGTTQTMALLPGSPAIGKGSRRQRSHHRPARHVPWLGGRHRRLPDPVSWSSRPPARSIRPSRA